MKIQIDDTVREATSDEIAIVQIIQSDMQNHVDEMAKKEAALNSARAKLAALGLTETEVKALIG
jgi:hypothetical protein